MSAKDQSKDTTETRLLKRPIFRVLILANFVLLMGILYIGTRVVNDRVAVMANEETAKLCQQLIDMVYGDGKTIEEAQSFARNRLSTGGVPVDLRLIQLQNGITIESETKLFSSSAFEETDQGAVYATTCVVGTAPAN